MIGFSPLKGICLPNGEQWEQREVNKVELVIMLIIKNDADVVVVIYFVVVIMIIYAFS